MIDTGDMAPDFTLPRDGGATLTLSAQRPAPVVLFFYPKDNTAGCTREATEFTAQADAFRALGASLIGVSKDSVASHDRFVAKHGLAMPLVSDEHGSVCEDYGTWVEKAMYGKTYMGIERSTFLIDGTGRIARVWRKVKVPGHVDEVLEALRAM